MIKVIENALPAELFQKYVNYALNLEWRLAVTNNYDARFNFEHRCDHACMHYPLFVEVAKALASHSDIPAGSLNRIRHAIMPLTNKDNTNAAHIDQDDPHISALIYLIDSDGDTIFYENDWETERLRVSPKSNTAVVFDGAIPHSSSRPSTAMLRMIGNYNFAID